MIQNLDINGVHFEISDDIRKYVHKKIGKLDRFVPKKAREPLQAEVFLKETKAKTKKEYTCEVNLRLPGETITVSETTINMFAAVDIVESKLKNQIKRYKETHGHQRIHRRVLARIRRQSV